MPRTVALLGVVLVGLMPGRVGAAAPPAAPSTPPAFRIFSDTTLPAALEWARDVRWASDKSVYLALAIYGAVEVSLDPAGPPLKEMIPAASKPGGFWSSERLAASSQYLVAAAPVHVLTWRRIGDPARVEVPFDVVTGVDLRESRLAILGVQRDEKGNFGPDGAIAWVGTLDKKLADLRPLLYDAKGPGTPMMARCGMASLGAVRFLPDDSLVVIPGVQPGVNLYDGTGKLVHTWDTSPLGIDADCATLTDDRALARAADRNAWLNQRRTVDTLLPLPQGPGLVVRRAEKGRTLWELELLRLDGTVQSFEVPIEGSTEFFHLRGDVRGGKIVFLLYETVFRGGGKDHPTLPRLIVAELPTGLAK